MKWTTRAEFIAGCALALVLSLLRESDAGNVPTKHSGRCGPRQSSAYPQSPPPRRKDAASPAVGLQGYQRYHANDSLVGRPVLCGHYEKLCFQFNMIYHDLFQTCIPWGEEVFDLSSRRLDKLRPFKVACEGYVMAYDDRCYRKEVVRDVICGCAAEPTRHFLNGVECRCANRAAIQVQQPKEEGWCRIPDLWFPDDDRSYFYRNPYERIQGFTSSRYAVVATNHTPRFTCSEHQQYCFAQGKLWAGERAGCVPLLERGPCPQEHVVALDVQAALKGHAVSTCVHVRGGCPPGHVRMVFDGNCHNESDVEFITRGSVTTNQFGLSLVTARRYFQLQPEKWENTDSYSPAVCAVVFIVPPSGGGFGGGVATTGQLFVKRYEVVNTPPLPE